ncbi:PDR/VanB family oxidoreductase [Dactylosporangium sp. AC04546]|uniref:PDR/VanB family oxidoreductase n=1 Tax=Dactylosporangium sp. AC04546 TaxID=2862460 RepID=UPI001EDCD54E|nr:PDR/VanB family oxidoreductase [Dactylosporangium sp. AC04546]WVK80520.1 PDR/VanB family oxidoreductase [Dactylosporangium sp. AC04546]
MSIQERFRRRLSPRNLQFAFGVFAVLAGTLIALRQDAPHPLFQAAGTAGYLCAAALSFRSWFALGRAGTAALTRRILIVFHLIFVPAQFLFLLAHQLPWLGMLLSTMIVVGLKPRIPQLGRTSRKVWLTLHVGIGVGWLGVALGMLVLSIVGMTTDRHELRHNAYVLVETFDKALAIPSVFLVIVTGAVVSLGTPWGLIKHRWVLTKLIIALSLPILATFEGTWSETLTERTEDPTAEPGGTGILLICALALFLSLLWIATILSVFKPGGRTRWGRRESTQERRPEITVTLAGVDPVAHRTAALDLTPAKGALLPAWEPGAHIDLVLPSGRVRQYSLCGDPADRHRYRIAVLHESDGRGGSAEVHRLAPGTTVRIRGPRNHFPLIDAPSYLFIAGGIGIAPFIPMIERLAADGARWHLVYRGQAPTAMAFHEQLARSHARQVTIAPADRQPRPDLAAILSAAPAGTAVYCCGPEAMLATVETLMPAFCPQGTLHVERFASSSRASGIPEAPFEAEMRRSGRVVQVPADRSLLSVLQDVDPSLDFSCENGVCGSCETRVLDGVPDHRDDVLQPGDRDRRDVIYPCVSRVRGSRIVLDL